MTKFIFFGLKNWEEGYIKTKIKEGGLKISAHFVTEALDKDHIPTQTDAEAISIFIDSTIDSAVLAKFPNLKFIAARSTGVDNIDLAACKERGIAVSYVPTYGENTVAEFAFALILCLSRKIFDAYDRIKETGVFSPEGLQGFDLKDKTLGVIGTGNIGKHVIKIGQGFGMKIVAYDPFENKKLASELGFEYFSLEDVLGQSDVVTLHVPYLPATHHLINAVRLALMKKSAILINTSRGAIIETEALVHALKSGQIAGAGLDVLEEENVIKDEMEFLKVGSEHEHDLKKIIANHVLIDMPNVIITPHNAFNTREAMERILNTTVENIAGYETGKPTNLAKI